MGRIEIVLGSPERVGARSPSGCATCSASRISRAPARVPLDVDAIAERDPRRPRRSAGRRRFRVSARRADKRFPLTSPQIEREVGGRIKEAQRLDASISTIPSSRSTSRC